MGPVNAAIQFHQVSRRFGRKAAVQDLSLTVPQGSIYAFLGPNGAGKTTTIKMMLGILFPDEGRIELLGQDSRRLGPAEKTRLGYVSENQQLPMWMRVDEFLAYCRRFYPNWDEAFCQELLTQFHLPKDRRLKELSRGMLGKVSLIAALVYRPELLVLDEPFTGLDPLVREEFIQGVLAAKGRHPWTVFISSHDMDEVERLCTHVGIIAHGKLLTDESTKSLQERFQEVSFRTQSINSPETNLPEAWLQVERSAGHVRVVHTRFKDAPLAEEIRRVFPDAEEIATRPMGLRDIFLALARRYRLEDSR